MQNDELDNILAGEPAILPSSEFTASVMAAIRREASAPAPLAFPWRRALPGLVASGLALAVLLQQVFVQPGITSARFSSPWLRLFTQVLETARHLGVHWILFAVFLSLASMQLSARLAEREETLVP